MSVVFDKCPSTFRAEIRKEEEVLLDFLLCLKDETTRICRSGVDMVGKISIFMCQMNFMTDQLDVGDGNWMWKVEMLCPVLYRIISRCKFVLKMKTRILS